MQLEKLKVTYPPELLPKSSMQKLHKRIRCARCGSYTLKKTKYYMKCSCGYHESKEEAIVRTACEYAVLTPNDNFTLGKIRAFIDGQVSEFLVRNTLEKYFKRTLNGKFIYYENKKLPYYKIHREFDFKYPAILYTKYSKLNMIVFN